MDQRVKNKKEEEFFLKFQEATDSAIEKINPSDREEILIEISESEAVDLVKKSFRDSELSVTLIDKQKREKERQRVREEFKDLNVGTTAGGGFLPPEFFIELLRSYIYIKVASFLVKKIVDDVEDIIWGKIKQSFINVFKGIEIKGEKRNVTINFNATFFFPKGMNQKNIQNILKQIPKILRSKKGKHDWDYYMPSSNLKKWKKLSNSEIEKYRSRGEEE